METTTCDCAERETPRSVWWHRRRKIDACRAAKDYENIRPSRLRHYVDGIRMTWQPGTPILVDDDEPL